ncbi:hypothetical protein ACUR5C_15770 [Aliikangiella sp. IMCC44653]
MKRLLLIAALILSCSALANDPKPEAPAELIQEIKLQCEEYAQEDQVADEDLADYLLSCVNDELTEQGYQTLESLD